MATVRVAAVQASYVLMDQQATLDKVAELTGKAAGQGAQLVAFPEVFIPGSPIWIDTRPIWDGDEAWFRLLAENAVTVPGRPPNGSRAWPGTMGSGWWPGSRSGNATAWPETRLSTSTQSPSAWPARPRSSRPHPPR
jgi:Carbon-nitrogen hydrolase